MDVSRFIGLSYLGVLVVAYIIFSKFLEWMAVLASIPTIGIIGTVFTATDLLALIISGGLVFWMKKHPTINPFVEDCVKELRKVTWPGFKETQRNTILVVVFSIVLSMSLWLMDQVWQRVTDYILTFGL